MQLLIILISFKTIFSIEISLLHFYFFKITQLTTLCSTFVSVPADFGGLSVDSYISGIIAGILEGAGFPARVTAHSVALEDGEAAPGTGGTGVPAATSVPGLPPRKEKTVFLVKFAQSVITRDSQIT